MSPSVKKTSKGASQKASQRASNRASKGASKENHPPFSPATVTFERELFRSEESAIFLVIIQETQYVLKVHHGCGPKQPYESRDRDTNPHNCEVKAYKSLQSHGLCDRGLVPKFYGEIKEFKPNLYRPHLKMFNEDKYPPKALLLEYIPGMTPLHFTNYTETRMSKLINGLAEMHKVGVDHSDVHPRNMMVFEDDPDRVLWIDFDRAQLVNPKRLTDKQKRDLDRDMALVKDIGVQMKADHEEGDMNHTAILYY